MLYTLNSFDDRVVDFAEGAYIYINGRQYIDTSLGNGTHILGHRSNICLTGGTLYGLKSTFHDKYVEILRERTQFNRFVFCNTGSEATMRAGRIARAYTGKDKIGIFEGSWHGTADGWLTCPGIPQAIKDLIVWLPYDESAIDIIKKTDLAMVFIDPIQGCLPKDNRGFLKTLREVTKEKNILFGFDEVVTGFRVARGGAKELFDIDVDIVTYGKIVGGGFPMGIVAGKTDIMDVVLRGVTTGGTFSANPVSIAQGYKVLKQLTHSVYEYLDSMGKRLREETKIPMVGVGSFNRMLFTDKPVKNRAERDALEDQGWKGQVYKGLYEKRICVGKNGLQFLSTAHTPAIVTKIIDAINTVA